MQQVKGANKRFSFGLTEENYNKLQKFHKIEGTNKNALFDLLLTDFFKDRCMGNDLISLKKPFFFNKYELFKREQIKPRHKEPTLKPKDHKIILRVPNNLDTWSNQYLTYCYKNNPENHRGVYPFPYIYGNALRYVYLLFEYKTASIGSFNIPDLHLRKVDELIITIVPIDNLGLIVNDRNILRYFHNLEKNIIFPIFREMREFKEDLTLKKKEEYLSKIKRDLKLHGYNLMDILINYSYKRLFLDKHSWI